MALARLDLNSNDAAVAQSPNLDETSILFMVVAHRHDDCLLNYGLSKAAIEAPSAVNPQFGRWVYDGERQ